MENQKSFSDQHDITGKNLLNEHVSDVDTFQNSITLGLNSTGVSMSHNTSMPNEYTEVITGDISDDDEQDGNENSRNSCVNHSYVEENLEFSVNHQTNDEQDISTDCKLIVTAPIKEEEIDHAEVQVIYIDNDTGTASTSNGVKEVPSRKRQYEEDISDKATIPPPPPLLLCGRAVSTDSCTVESKASSSLLSERNKVESRRLHECKECLQNFTSLSNLLRHKWEHISANTYTCYVCKKKFAKDDIVVHTVQNGEKFIGCRGCEGILTMRIKMVATRVHKAENTYPCNLCGKVYLKEANLKNHIVKYHDFLHENNRSILG